MARALRAWWLVVATLPVASLQLASCSDESPAEPSPAVDAAIERRDAPVEDGGVGDVAEASTIPAPALPTCIGTSLPLVISGERAYVSVNVTGDGDGGGSRGDFVLDFGSNGSTIDLNAFAPSPPTPTSCLGDAGGPGAICYFDGFDFFGPWGTVALVTGDYSFLFNSLKQAGIIGTDFLSLFPFTLQYTKTLVSKGSADAFCTDAQLLGAGMVPIPTGGFYTKNTATLRPLSDVIVAPDAATTAGYSVPNIPTVPIAIGGVSALAQLDTGYDDRIDRHAININQALLEQLLAKIPGSLIRRTSKDLYLTTCIGGLSQAGAAYALAPGTTVSFLTAAGTPGRIDSGSYVFVKERLAEAERCGGIETWTVPAAQLGASFLVDAQAVVFDPITSRVWLPSN